MKVHILYSCNNSFLTDETVSVVILSISSIGGLLLHIFLDNLFNTSNAPRLFDVRPTLTY